MLITSEWRTPMVYQCAFIQKYTVHREVDYGSRLKINLRNIKRFFMEKRGVILLLTLHKRKLKREQGNCTSWRLSSIFSFTLHTDIGTWLASWIWMKLRTSLFIRNIYTPNVTHENMKHENPVNWRNFHVLCLARGDSLMWTSIDWLQII